jgi:hypothetical protein
LTPPRPATTRAPEFTRQHIAAPIAAAIEIAPPEASAGPSRDPWVLKAILDEGQLAGEQPLIPVDYERVAA